ncbi:Tannase/feruloyl esterase [Plectosphaerella cucumerina]|uniref:Carboxylic ester hydrolase n=1 Tax=Plectosphaerella cucumerina TaxID=40658 RepID=A0A8K0TDG3_9PEZI|nr:Tannase/feruloyl esterase [Plectosphaerella cucumerina]
MTWSHTLLLSGLATLSAASPVVLNSTASFQDRCRSLPVSLNIPNSNSTATEFVPAGTTLTFAGADPSCGRASQNVTVDLCRVSLQVATSARSGIKMEAWLPAEWSGRFLSTGNGGLGGCIQYEDIQYAASLGFAAVGTNNGHDGSTGESFLNNPDVIEDYAYRALRTGVLLGKDITKTFYGQAQAKSYYMGCSTGGRQGFKEAQTFADDFDGIVAGAPAFSFNNLTSWSSFFYPLTGPPTATTFVPLQMWPIIGQDILRQCDGLDGAVDGILESPDLCNYDPSGLICPAGASNITCLTEIQAETVRKIYSPLLNDKGDFVYPRMQPGGESTEAAFAMFNGQPFGSSDWWRFAIFSDPNWDPLTLKPADFPISSTRNLFNIETFDGDLSAFKNAGGKLLHYHGLADGIITSENSPRYYEHVLKTMGLAPAQLDDFYRFFRISGMRHCFGGPGAAAIGNGGFEPVHSLDPEENVLMAIVRWVEEGIAPESVVGTRFVNEDQSAGVDYKRRHCKYPARNVFQGTGDVKDIDSWACVV